MESKCLKQKEIEKHTKGDLNEPIQYTLKSLPNSDVAQTERGAMCDGCDVDWVAYIFDVG